MEENKTENKKEKNNKKKILIIIGIILLLIILFLLWWFNRKFDVTFKYNNGEPDYTVKVKYKKLIDEKDIKEELIYKEHSFIGYFETYIPEKTCKEGFELNKEKDKCISKTKFDFKNTKIKKDTTIEAMWSTISFTIDPTSKTINEGDSFTIKATLTGAEDKTVKWSSENDGVAKVDNNGKVTGVKKGDVNIIAESNGIKRTCKVTVKEIKKEETPKDTGKLTLSSSKTCIVGNNSVNIVAKITGNSLDRTIKWTYPKCYTATTPSALIRTLKRNNACSSTEELTAKVSGKLSNGSSSTASFKYEPTLTFEVYDGKTKISPRDGAYHGSAIKIVTNINATFSGKSISSKTSNSVSLYSSSDSTITIKTSCGQTEKIQVYAVIN